MVVLCYMLFFLSCIARLLRRCCLPGHKNFTALMNLFGACDNKHFDLTVFLYFLGKNQPVSSQGRKILFTLNVLPYLGPQDTTLQGFSWVKMGLRCSKKPTSE